MKLKIVYTLFSALALGFLFMSNSGGRAATQDAGNTGAPGDQEQSSGAAWTCQTCHTGPLQVTMEIEVFEEGTSMVVTDYLPGATYDVKVTLDDINNDASGYGFQMVSLVDTDDSDVNGWSSPSANAQIATTSTTNRSYVEHDGISSSNVFEIKWTAPADGSGSVTFYAAGTGVNENNMSSGDGGATSTLTLQEGPVGIFNTLELDARVSVYPNPVTDYLNVNVESAFTGDVLAEIMDLQGRVIETRSVGLDLGDNSERFETTHLHTGTYLLRLSKDTKILTKQFVKR